jgi:hypothetical protein
LGQVVKFEIFGGVTVDADATEVLDELLSTPVVSGGIAG